MDYEFGIPVGDQGNPSPNPQIETEELNSVWSKNGDIFSAVQEVVDELPAGVYEPEMTMDGKPFLMRQELNVDNMVLIKDSTSAIVLNEIKTFWDLKSKFDEYGFIHKRGILLAGPPGGGKTVTINLVVKNIVEDHAGIALFFTSPLKTSRCLKVIRNVEENRPIVVIIEDIDEVIKIYGEALLLDMLDGGAQINNVVFIATTNHVNKLEDRITKRPSRFDTVLYVNPPSYDLRRAFLQSKDHNITEEELDKWADITNGLSFAHLKELIILVRCFGLDVAAAIDKLTNTDVVKEELEYERNKGQTGTIGFKFNPTEDSTSPSIKENFNDNI